MARGRWLVRDLPSAAWLLLAVVVALIHRSVPDSIWLMIHLVLLGAVTHAICVWSTHFSDALLKTGDAIDPRRSQSIRLWALFAGVALVLVGYPTRVWPLVLVGAVIAVGAVLWHGLAIWRRLGRALPGRFRASVHHYLAAAALLPVGGTLGVWLATRPEEVLRGRLLVAHALVNLLGWVGLTVVGTLVTLWPTMLRTRMDPNADRRSRQALPVLIVGVLVAAAGPLVDQRLIAAGGVLIWLAGFSWTARALITALRKKPARDYPTLAAAAAVGWLAAGLVDTVVVLVAAPDWPAARDAFTQPVAIFTAGFALQLLTGALSWLIPSVVGGGPAAVRAGLAAFNRLGVLRVVLINGGLLLSLIPVPSAVKVASSLLVLIGLAAFLPLLFGGIRASRRAKDASGSPAADPPAADPPARPASGQLVAGVTLLALAVALGVGWDPVAAGLPGTVSSTSSAAPVTPTGQTTTVRVEARTMRFVPDRVQVPLGDRLLIEVVNTDVDQVHDLVLANGAHGRRIAPGESEVIDAGVIGGPVDGWCSVVGHRQMGMLFSVAIAGATASAGAHPTGHASPAGQSGADAVLDPMATPDAAFRAPDASLPALTTPAGTTHQVTLRVQEVEREVAPGVTQKRWTFGATAPGPVLHGRVGDRFVVTLINDGSIGHSIDFHAGALAPDRPMRTIQPGETLTYTFTATKAGIWMYHCSTMPMSAHIAAGMHGAVIIEPDDLPAVDRSYVLVQSELYFGPQGGEVDALQVSTGDPDAVTFNGYAFAYDHAPLAAAVGERVRIWVLDAGPNRSTSFHVVGGQFDTLWMEGAYRINRSRTTGSQALGLTAAQGGFVELVFPEPGHYPFVSHAMVDAERGAHGIFEVR